MGKGKEVGMSTSLKHCRELCSRDFFAPRGKELSI